jgi:hypothetical protein
MRSSWSFVSKSMVEKSSEKVSLQERARNRPPATARLDPPGGAVRFLFEGMNHWSSPKALFVPELCTVTDFCARRM